MDVCMDISPFFFFFNFLFEIGFSRLIVLIVI